MKISFNFDDEKLENAKGFINNLQKFNPLKNEKITVSEQANFINNLGYRKRNFEKIIKTDNLGNTKEEIHELPGFFTNPSWQTEMPAFFELLDQIEQASKIKA